MRGVVALALSLAACAPEPTEDTATAPSATAIDPVAAAVSRIRAIEQRERDAADFGKLPPASAMLGADPYALVSVEGDHVAGILRGDDAVALHDGDMHRTSRARWASPTGLASCGDRVFVVGETTAAIGRFVRRGDTLIEQTPVPVPHAVALRDVACHGDVLYVVDEASDQLTIVRDDELVTQPTCAAPIDVERVEDRLLVRCLIDHSVVLRGVDGHGVPIVEGERRIQHDGPIWSMALRGDQLALGGVEDHALDRRQGFFGYVDSFVFLYELGDTIELVGRRNVSADGVVTPKTVSWRGDTIFVTGYGTAGAITVDSSLTVVERHPEPPGSTAILWRGTQRVVANPLLDAWVIDGETLVHERAPLDAEQRLGEVLAFTTLMAPHNTSTDAHSRFTCETCHFEGYGDGRTHHTGRGNVRATTKPLYGLFNNRPHFTRALDPDLTRVAHAEFRVAGKGNGHDPWFTLSQTDHPWLAVVHEREQHDAETQRVALLRFLMAFNHRANPVAQRAGRFDELSRRGAELFAERCVRCHAARLSTDDAGTEVPFAAWERAIFSHGALVWARPGYEKTGVEPYVHEDGARTSSLRRLYRKRPYFTNGSAPTLEAVLKKVGWVDAAFFHERAPAAAVRLSEAEQKALAAFLRLL